MTRRANALVLLDDGWSCREVAKALLLDDDTIRGWRELFEQGGIEGLTSFDMGGSAGFMSAAQEDNLKAWVAASCRVDAPGRGLDRAGIWPRLRKPLGTDRAAAPPGSGVSQAERHPAQARRSEAEGLHRKL